MLGTLPWKSRPGISRNHWLSGAGKTTLMSLLAGLIKPDAGSIKLHGKPMEGPGPDRGIVFQNYSLLPWLTVYENIALAVDQVFCDWSPERRRAHRKANRHGEADAGARSDSARTLWRDASTSPWRALSVQPELLLLDEPLSALDALTRANLQDEINRICQEEENGHPDHQ